MYLWEGKTQSDEIGDPVTMSLSVPILALTSRPAPDPVTIMDQVLANHAEAIWAADLFVECGAAKAKRS
jgi:hypothetical protein